MPKEPTKVFSVTLPLNIFNALETAAAERETPMAGLVRHALELWFQSQGIEVKDNVLWGGYRYPGDKRD